MKRHRLLLPINVALAVAIVGVLLGCGDVAHVKPPPGSIEESFCGDWQTDPLPGGGDCKHTTRTLAVSFLEGYGSFWGEPGLVANYRETAVPMDGVSPSRTSIWESTSGLTVNGRTAIGESSRTSERSTWELRLDANDQNTLYVTWTKKDGTKRLDSVKFHKK